LTTLLRHGKKKMINLTEQAKDYLSSMVDSYQKKYAYLSVNGGGCSGFTYKWDMVDTDENGTVIDDLLVLDQMAEMFVMGCTVDYVKGEVIINTINIVETTLASGVVEVQAYPESNDIIGLKDLYLQLDMSNTKINIVRDTISSGQQISGIGYKVTSSYSNGTIVRQ